MNKSFTVVDIQTNDDSTFFLTTEKNGLNFLPGQYVTISHAELTDTREYSIYSGVEDDYLVFLIKKIKNGIVSNFLSDLKAKDKIEIGPPIGDFLFDNNDKKKIFIATGTGIAPFHAYVKSGISNNYMLIHGIRDSKSFYDYSDFDRNNLISCTSRSREGDFGGRVTDFLKQNKNLVRDEYVYYLCGNFSMISDGRAYLLNCGIRNIKTEIFY